MRIAENNRSKNNVEDKPNTPEESSNEDKSAFKNDGQFFESYK